MGRVDSCCAWGERGIEGGGVVVVSEADMGEVGEGGIGREKGDRKGVGRRWSGNVR